MAPSKARPVQPEDLYELKTVNDARVSPDGKTVAYVLRWYERDADEVRSSIYVASMDDSARGRRFTYGNKDNSPRWSPDGRWLAFVCKRGEEPEQIFLAPLEGGEPRQLTKAKFGAGQPAWSPDSQQIAYVARTGDFKEIKDRTPIERSAPRVVRDVAYKFDGVGLFDERRHHLFLVNVDEGKERQLTDGDWHDEHPSWSPDGSRIVFVSDRTPKRWQRHFLRDVWMLPISGGRPRKLTRSRGGASYPAFSPDGTCVAYVGHEHGDDFFGKNTELLVVPLEGNIPPRSFSSTLDRSVASSPLMPSPPSWSADGSSLFFLASDRGTLSLYCSNIKDGATVKLLGGDRAIDSFSFAPNGGSIAFSASDPDHPSEIWMASLDNPAVEANVSHANEELLQNVLFGHQERMTYRAADGMEIEALVLYPPGYTSDRRCPLALQIHGGPHGDHISSFILGFQSLAAAGYVVLLPNPRGSGSYGEAFTRACIADWGGKDFDDLMTGVDELISRGVADPARLYVGGYSYGGFMTTWTVGKTDRFQAAAVGAPVTNLTSMYGTSDIPLFLEHETGGTPLTARNAYNERSPVAHLNNVRTPVMLYHSEGDMRCPIGQSEEIFQTLKLLGREVEFLRYPGGSHNQSTPSQTIDRMHRVRNWFDSHPKRTGKPSAR
jgi:dipeptidyl aminopeptidase/acylaminoacyl peptidase